MKFTQLKVYGWHEPQLLLQNVSQRKATGKDFSTLRSVNTDQILLINKIWIEGYLVSSTLVIVNNQRLFRTRN